MPIYRVKDSETGSERFVEAKRVEQAINHVVGSRFTAERVTVETFEPEAPPPAAVDANPPYSDVPAMDEPTYQAAKEAWRELA